MSECPYCQNTFEMTETCADEFVMWQGLVGPYYFPYIDENGVLIWSNTGDLPNPDPINIVGPPGAGLEFSGSAATVGDLPASANEYDIYIVGTSAPFYGYIYENGGWTNIGQVGRGEQGISIVSVTKASGTGAPGTTDTYDVNLSDSTVAGQFTVYNGEDGQGSPGSSTPLADTTGGAVGTAVAYSREDHQHPLNVPTSGTPEMDGTASQGSATTYSRADHVHPTDTSRASQTDMTTAQGNITSLQSGKADANAFKGFTVTLSSSGWSSNAQTVSDEKFIASGYSYIVSPASSSFADYASAQIYADDVSTNGQMTFHCTDVPSSNLTVNIVRVVAS